MCSMDQDTLRTQADKKKSRPHPQAVAQQLGLYASTNILITTIRFGEAPDPSGASLAREPGTHACT
jgi:hypothetical protein